MPPVTPKRGRSKRCKPPPLKLSFGSASGGSGILPTTMEASLSELVEQLEIKRQLAQVEDDWCSEDANGSVTRWSAHKYSPKDFETDSPEDLDYGPGLARGREEVRQHLNDASGEATERCFSHRQDFELDGPEAVEDRTDSVGLKAAEEDEEGATAAGDAAVLTEADMADIIRRCRAFLEERGPSQEEELCCHEVLGPHRPGLVRTSLSSLTAFLAQQPGFTHTREGDLSFLYYMDPQEEEGEGDGDSASAAPPVSPPTATSGLLLSDDSLEDGPAEARGVAEERDGLKSGRDASPCGGSSTSHTSYLSALDEWEEERRDACTQTEEKEAEEEEEAPSCRRCQWHSAQEHTHDGQTQTSCLDTAELVEQELRLKEKIRLLEARIASLEDDHDREIRELRLAFEGLLQQCRCRQASASPLPPPPPEEQRPSLQEAANGFATAGEEEAHRTDSFTSGEGGGVTGADEKGTGGPQLPRPVVRDDVLSNGICTAGDGAEDGSHAGSPSSRSGGGTVPAGASFSRGGGAAHTGEKEQEESPSEPPVAKPIQGGAENGSSGPDGAAGCPPGLDLMELRWRLEQLRATSCTDLDSSMAGAASRCGSVCSTARTKSEAQITKIVTLLKKQLPHCSEADIRGHVDRVRRLRGGFSHMTIRDIAALVHSYVRQQQQGPQRR
ncbi:uncharacterized protein LOC144166790 [Haemaphysalis longicornis]